MLRLKFICKFISVSRAFLDINTRILLSNILWWVDYGLWAMDTRFQQDDDHTTWSIFDIWNKWSRQVEKDILFERPEWLWVLDNR